MSSIKDSLQDKFITKMNNFKLYKFGKLSNKVKIGIASGLVGVTVFSTAFLMMSDTDVYSLTIAGKDVGYITDNQIVEEIVEDITSDLTISNDGIEVFVEDTSISCQPTDLQENDVEILTDEELQQKIIASDICKTNGWAANVNGKNIAVAATQKDAESVLSGVKDYYKTQNAEMISATFIEDVTVTQAAVKLSEIIEPANAVNFIITGTKAPMTYTVKDGDTVWDVASSNGISTEELQNANPGFDPNKLKIGQQLNLFVSKPLVTVETKELVATKEKIDFETIYENTNALSKGVIQVKTAGVYGTKEVKSEVSKINGVVTSSVVIESLVTAEPQKQIALKGTKANTTYVASRGGGRSISVDASGGDIVAYAKKYIGTPYVYGGSTPDGFDCSGFTQYVMNNFGASLPHSSSSQYGYGTYVEKSQLQAGDLVFFKTSKSSSSIGHVGIYVGGGKYIHSPQPGQSVEINSMSNSYSASRYYGATRITN